MDSKQQDDMSGVLKFILSLVVLLIEVIITIGWSSNVDRFAFEKSTICMTVNNEVNVLAPRVMSQLSYNNTNDDIKLNNSHLTKVVNVNYLISSEENIENNFKNMNTKVEGYAISISDNIFGYVASSEQREAILNDICQKYINELGLDKNNVSNLSVTGKIIATQDLVNIAQLTERSEISEEIYNASIVDNDLLGVQMTVNLTQNELIEPEVVIKLDDSLYMGEEEVINEGIYGSKLVFKEITYDGLNISSEKSIGEEIICNAIPTVILKGVKNPYLDGIAFLTNPVMGGQLTSNFGEYRPSSYHKGIDYAQKTGENVFAAFSGKVSYAGYNEGGYGNLVILEHDNNMKTYYAHLNSISVSLGEEVNGGEIVGFVGSTGFSTGPHLHFELRINDEPVNPINYILQ